RPADEKPESRMARINEAMAETVQRSDGRLLGLATIDAYAGDVAADELSRAVSDLGLVGAFVESASGNEILSAPRARPALEAAAKLNVPVFVHPVQETAQTRQFNLKGFYQTNLGRGAMNSIALAGLLEAGVFDELPTLRTCFSSFAVTAILFGGLFNMTRPDAADLLRQHVYVDTVGVHPTMMRAMIDVLGVDRLVVGTDWPVFRGYSVRDRLIEACYELELSAPYRNMIASENAKRLLGMDAFAPLG
ncbi:MAG: amidohydrolase family protein, partial [Pseudomonadota bacterium]